MGEVGGEEQVEGKEDGDKGRGVKREEEEGRQQGAPGEMVDE